MCRLIYPDSNVWIAAARRDRGDPAYDAAWRVFLRDGAVVASSQFVLAEVLPAPLRRRNDLELKSISLLRRVVERWAAETREVIELAVVEMSRVDGLAPMDAFHLAAAHSLGCAEFVTLEKPGKPMYRSRLVKVEWLMGA